MRAYFYLAERQMAAGFSRRFEILAQIAGGYVEILAAVFLWEWVFRERESLHGMSGMQMRSWVILSAGLTVFYSVQVHLRMRREAFRRGLSALSPCSAAGLHLARDLGNAAVNLSVKSLPLMVLGGLSFGLLPPAGTAELLLALCGAAAGYLMIWLMYAIVGASSCWLMGLGDLGVALTVLIAFLSGSLLPLEFFPQPVQSVLSWLPFRYAFQTPLSLYLGKMTVPEGIRQLAAQAVWILLLYLAGKLLWDGGQKRLSEENGS